MVWLGLVLGGVWCVVWRGGVCWVGCGVGGDEGTLLSACFMLRICQQERRINAPLSPSLSTLAAERREKERGRRRRNKKKEEKGDNSAWRKS